MRVVFEHVIPVVMVGTETANFGVEHPRFAGPQGKQPRGRRVGYSLLVHTIGRSLLATGYACSCSSREFLLRKDIFDLEKAVVIETPQLGHATYVFAKPRSMESFLVLYTRITKEDIRRNRDTVGERLGFLGRVIHGVNPRAWLKEMRQRLGEKVDFASTVGE